MPSAFRMTQIKLLTACTLVISVLIPAVVWAADAAKQPVIRFEEVTESAGLVQPLAGILGHGGAWGDFNADGKPDLFVGGFCDRPDGEYSPAAGPVPCRLFLNQGAGPFQVVERSETEVYGRTSGAVFADLDNNGTLDLFVAHNARPSGQAGRGDRQREAQAVRSQLFRNRSGRLSDVTIASGAVPKDLLSARNIGVFDYDADSLLDLFIIEDQFVARGRTPRSALLRNVGDFRFQDVTREAGLPENIYGLGIAVADLNEDHRPDFFVGHSNRMFLSQAGNRYREASELGELFGWKPLNKEDWPCGAAFGDLNRDGRPDLVIGVHHETARNRVYLNEGSKDGMVRFRDITDQVLSNPVPTKCPHVEIQDFDNDGNPDIFFSAGWLDPDGGFTPLIYRNHGVVEGLPRLEPLRPISEPMVYFPAAPTADYDGDGNLDLFLINWFAGNRCRLLRNVTQSDHWLRVSVRGSSVNRQGIGTKVRLYSSGELGNHQALLGSQEIHVGFGYASGQESIAHFGLGDTKQVDVEIVLPNAERLVQKNVRADQMVMIKQSPAKKPQASGKAKPRTAAAVERQKQAEREAALTYPPQLPDGAPLATDKADAFLKPIAALQDGVIVAATPPTIDFAFFPGQTYPGRPWSNWGDSSFANGKYYTAIGDHLAPQGNAFVFEYDPTKKTFRRLLDLRKLLAMPDGHYTPGKIHSRVEMGRDGWLYCSTHRGSTNATTEANHYQGDWIVRCHPESAAAEVIAQGPLGKRCIPNGTLDPERLIFYGGTAPGDAGDNTEVMFFAYDLRARQLLYSCADGPQRYMILTKSGKVYYTPRLDTGPLMRFDAASGKPPEKIPGEIGIRAATRETPDGSIYTVSMSREAPSRLYRFNASTEAVEDLGPAAVGSQNYVAAMTADPTGRYVYYVPGAHGGSDQDGSAVVQFDTKLRQRKVIAFLHPFYNDRYGATLKGTYGVAINEDGSTLCITWNVSRGSRAWDCCAVTAIHIAPSERPK